MTREEKKAIKELLKLGIEKRIFDQRIFQILKNAKSKDLMDLFYEAYLEVVKKEGREKQKELGRTR